MGRIQEIDSSQELKVIFYPELLLQRRIWILNILRNENITKACYLFCLINIRVYLIIRNTNRFSM